MKLLFLTLALGLSVSLNAQATHQVTLTWTDTLNPTGTTYNAYRATGVCSGTPTFSKLQTGIAAKTYQDTSVTPGAYCYEVTAVYNSVESSPSNTVNPSVPPSPPTSLGVTSVSELLIPKNMDLIFLLPERVGERVEVIVPGM